MYLTSNVNRVVDIEYLICQEPSEDLGHHLHPVLHESGNVKLMLVYLGQGYSGSTESN